MKEALDLIDYIALHHSGNQAAFGRTQGVKPQQVTKWLDMGCIVVDGKLYSPRRDIDLPDEAPKMLEPQKGDTLMAYGVSITSVSINEKGEISAKGIEPESFYVSAIKE